MEIPNVVQQGIKGAEELIAKGVSASDLATTTYSPNTSLIAPQNLSPLLTNLAYRETSFYQRVRKPKGFGQAASFNLVGALFDSTENANPREMFYADGGLPPERKTLYKNVTNPYKDLGYKGSVTGRAIRMNQGGTPDDLEAEEVRNTMQRVVQGVDWLSFWSRDDVTNTAGFSGFKGLDQMISTNVIDAGGANISKALIDRAARSIGYQGGAGMTRYAIFASYGVSMDINNLYNTQQQLIVNTSDERANLTFGNYVKYIRSGAIGDTEVVANYFINPGTPYSQGQPYSASSGPRGLNVSTLFILPMDFVTYEELLPISKIDLALVADKKDFMVINSGAITLTAEPWAAKITNITESVTNS